MIIAVLIILALPVVLLFMSGCKLGLEQGDEAAKIGYDVIRSNHDD